jgi:hypothetical protein
LKKFSRKLIFTDYTRIGLIRVIKNLNLRNLSRIYFEEIKGCEEIFRIYDKKFLKLNYDNNKIVRYAFEEKNIKLLKDIVKNVDDEIMIKLYLKYFCKVSFEKTTFIDFLDIWITKKYKGFDSDFWECILFFCKDKCVFDYIYKKVIDLSIKFDIYEDLLKYSNQHFDIKKIIFLQNYI